LIVVDAVHGGESPGTIYRFELEDIEKAGTTGTSFSLHDIGVVEALGLERLVYRIPKEIVVIGIEPQRVALSMELSPTIERKLPALVQAVLGELETYAARESDEEKN